jgi:Protein of unknown function (DUF3485)
MPSPVLQNPPALAAKKLMTKVVCFLVLITLTVVACFVFKPAAVVSEAGVVMHWPDRVLDFTGKEEPVSEAELKLLPADTEFAKKIYSNPKGQQLSAQIVLSGVEHRSIHRPEICLVGQGWNVRAGQIVKVPLKSGHAIDVMVLDITRPVRTQNGGTLELPALYAYFFVSKDAETAKHLDRIAITNLDLLLHNKAHRWAYVITMAQVLKGLTPGGMDREQALQQIKDFIREAAPEFLRSEIPPVTAKN